MKRIEGLHKNSIYLKGQTHVVVDAFRTGGYSRPCATSWSAAGSITFNSDKEGSADGEGGEDGHESWQTASGSIGCGGSPGC